MALCELIAHGRDDYPYYDIPPIYTSVVGQMKSKEAKIMLIGTVNKAIEIIVDDSKLSKKLINLLIELNYDFNDNLLIANKQIYDMCPNAISPSSYDLIFAHVFLKKYNKYAMMNLLYYEHLDEFIIKHRKSFDEYFDYLVKSKFYGFSTKKYFSMIKNNSRDVTNNKSDGVINLLYTLEKLNMYDHIHRALATGIAINMHNHIRLEIDFSTALISECKRFNTAIIFNDDIDPRYLINLKLLEYLRQNNYHILTKRNIIYIFFNYDKKLDITESKISYINSYAKTLDIDIDKLLKNLLFCKYKSNDINLELIHKYYPHILTIENVTIALIHNIRNKSEVTTNKLLKHDFDLYRLYNELFHPDVTRLDDGSVEFIIRIFANNNILDPIILHRIQTYMPINTIKYMFSDACYHINK